MNITTFQRSKGLRVFVRDHHDARVKSRGKVELDASIERIYNATNNVEGSCRQALPIESLASRIIITKCYHGYGYA